MPKIKKIINDPNACAAELLDGLVEAYDGEAKKVGRGCIVMSQIRDQKPALLVGGGTGHEPIYHGLVGHNLADGAACGDIFAAPRLTLCWMAHRPSTGGKVCCICMATMRGT